MNDQTQDQLYRFGGGSADSTLTLGTGVFVLFAILLIFLLPRKYVVLPILFVTLFIPYGQVIVVAGLHFNIYRMLIPFGWVRVFMGARPEGERFQLNGIDKAVMAWAITDAIFDTLLWGSSGALINRVGSLYNVFGLYFLLRLLIRNQEDVQRVLKTLSVICACLAVFMILEQMTGRNVFSVFGGVPEITAVRDGKIRSQAAFAHAIVAGTVGATLVPLFIGLWRRKDESGKFAGLGVLAGTVMTITSSSATPLLSLFAGIGALFLWPLRRHMRIIRWGILGTIVGLHMVMKAPVWALIGRISVIGGNSSWHRSELIGTAIHHLGDWWLFGAKNPGSWGWEMGDVSNAFVNAGYSGGLLALIFFIAIFWQAFRAIGLKRKKSEDEQDYKSEIFIWAFGATLFSTMISYLGIWYFDQSVLIWYALLAMIGATTSAALARAPVVEPETPGLRAWRQAAPAAVTPSVVAAAKRTGPPGFAASRARLADSLRR